MVTVADFIDSIEHLTTGSKADLKPRAKGGVWSQLGC